MLRLLCRRQPPTAGNALGVEQSLQNVFRDDEQVLDGGEPRIFFCRRAVDVRSTSRLMLDDCGANFSTRGRRVGDYVEVAGAAVDGAGVGCVMWVLEDIME